MSLATVKSPATKTDAPGGSSAPARVSAGRRRRILPTILGGYLPLVVIVLVVAVPLGWMILSSFKQVS